MVLALRNKTAKTPKQSLKGSTRHFPLFWHHSASFQIYFYPPKQNLQTLGILQRVNAVTGSRKKSKKNAHKMHIPGNFEEKNTKECEGKEPQIPPRFWCCCRDLSGFCRNFLSLSGFVGICRALNTGGGVPITSFGGSWSKAKWRVILVLFYVIRPSLSSIKTQLWGAQKHQQLDRGRFGLLQNVFCQKKLKCEMKTLFGCEGIEKMHLKTQKKRFSELHRVNDFNQPWPMQSFFLVLVKWKEACLKKIRKTGNLWLTATVPFFCGDKKNILCGEMMLSCTGGIPNSNSKKRALIFKKTPSPNENNRKKRWTKVVQTIVQSKTLLVNVIPCCNKKKPVDLSGFAQICWDLSQ